MQISELKPDYDLALADLIRDNLKKFKLDIPGTVYFDDNLNHLSDFYISDPGKRFYYIMTDDNDKLIGGIGMAEFEFFEDCCELQKLYLADEVKGEGLSYKLISMIEDKAGELGYKRMYLETHDNLAAAIHVYEKAGYKEIEKPAGIVHATMNRFFIKELSMSDNKNVDSGELDELVKMIDGKMESGISRLGVSFSDKKEAGSVSETHYHGKKDSWNPGVWGERHGER